VILRTALKRLKEQLWPERVAQGPVVGQTGGWVTNAENLLEVANSQDHAAANDPTRERFAAW